MENLWRRCATTLASIFKLRIMNTRSFSFPLLLNIYSKRTSMLYGLNRKLFVALQIQRMWRCSGRVHPNICAVLIPSNSAGAGHLDRPRLCAGGKWLCVPTKGQHGDVDLTTSSIAPAATGALSILTNSGPPVTPIRSILVDSLFWTP